MAAHGHFMASANHTMAHAHYAPIISDPPRASMPRILRSCKENLEKPASHMVLAEATTGAMHKIKEKVWNDRIMESSFARPRPGLDGLKPGFVEDETDVGGYV
ncbi:hypothetical protein SNOG_02971 [Parastagonospora nodorum SN15]|uniref:Uncharacterized protein n=1 Tax=Phaeosphaeria nodorum (strain SN15 / ATCC MYA-4574 / FGSC 10173) TaxID=321614 RepID=Q0UZ43_PHANO|nr:hypothetical protein SNOG_02971 [Parastagonospora nodorum SN15]EAT89702.1 hypothetical protein SNOG_02971 [Parastagonospora nodorum SN15]